MTADKNQQMPCQGCGTPTTTSFQCPLCQAEGVTDRGYFCTQECFAKNWLEHRNTLHKSGVVRERRAAVAPVDNAPAEHLTRKGKKRARDAAAAAAADDDDANADGRTKSAGGAASAALNAPRVFAPWPALPSTEVCAAHQWATVTPALPLDVPRAVVRPAAAAHHGGGGGSTDDCADYFWSALLAAAQYTSASVRANAQMQVLVVAGDVYSAHAFAWAARCVGLTGLMQLAVASSASTRGDDADDDVDHAAGGVASSAPSTRFTAHKRIVIATAAVVRESALRESAASTATSGAAALWLTGPPSDSLLLTLPDVADAADLQGVQTRAVFFTGPAGLGDDDDDEGETEEEAKKQQEAAEAAEDAVGTRKKKTTKKKTKTAAGSDSTPLVSKGYAYSNVEVKGEDGVLSQPRWSPVCLPAPGTSSTTATSAAESGDHHDASASQLDSDKAEASAASANPLVTDARQLTGPHHPSTRLDDEACTCFANGDVSGALQRLVRYFQDRPGHLESSLFYLLCCNWGTAGLAHAHHRLAYVARFFADQSRRFATTKKNATLADAALRAVAAVVRALPRMRDAEAEEAAAAASASSSTVAAEAKGQKKKKAAKTEQQDGASAAAMAMAMFDKAMPTLASTTRATLPSVGDVSAASPAEVARLANYFTHLPNLQLQATVCYLYDIASPAVLDCFAKAWGMHRYLPGRSALSAVEAARSAAVLRVRQRFTTKLDAANGEFYSVLMQFVYDAVGPYSLTVDEVQRRLLWNMTLAHDAGSLEAFLQAAALLPTADGMLLPTAKKQKIKKAPASMYATAEASSSDAPASAAASSSSTNAAAAASTTSGAKSLSSRQLSSSKRETVHSRTEKLRCFAVKTTTTATPDTNYGFIELPWKTFPITGERQRQVDRLHRTAVEEVLMAMPRDPRPMYVGDVGNLIGKWAHFNSRFEGCLGATLQVFLEAHPEAFRVVDRLVTRRTAGTSEQVRIRFDNDEDHNHNDDDSDDDNGRSRKNRDRQMLTGQKGKNGKTAIELPARARKKRAVKEFNKERFNRNYKSIDASARVPGYVKHAPRRIKGRGKKANKRLVKRSN